MNPAEHINSLIKKHRQDFGKVVDFNPRQDKIVSLDFTADNPDLTATIINDIQLFCDYIDEKLAAADAKFGVGGYMEYRSVYARSRHFDTEGEPRRLHLGVDIWGSALTPVYAFFDAKVHSFAFNDHFGDYGATIILEHDLENSRFYSLYGHLSLESVVDLKKGQYLNKGSHFCDFGIPEENGHWPPHLHFQLMCTMEGLEGDYPGVGKLSEKKIWLKKIPDANLLLNWTD